jgi:S-adenosylmethionine:tRNA ribosyltransferase-isomerase
VIQKADLEYELPPGRIAQRPVEPRDAARLLVLDRASGQLSELRFSELPAHLGPDDLTVVNDTRVIPARLRGHKASGGQAEVLLVERASNGSWLALVRTGGRLRPGLMLYFGKEELLEQLGEVPLPPYIRRDEPLKSDPSDYQSIFAEIPGAVAAPTASLHFTPELAGRMQLARVTLHVGPGTFRPIRCERLEDHRIEPERFEVPAETAEAIARARAASGRVTAVGTTVVRALETSGERAASGRTNLVILPGYEFRVVDSLITNFHMPGSSLLALVQAFAGVEATKRAYTHAIAEGFRFYSYGDAMWIR